MSESHLTLRAAKPAAPDLGLDRGLEGMVHPDFANVAKAFRRILGRGRRGGAAFCVYHRGECVVDIWGGARDAEGRPWRQDTLALSFSTTKGVVSTLLHILVDRGLLDYDEPVARYWPEFAQAGKATISVRQIMCHEAGLYDVRKMVDGANRFLDWDYMVEAIERAEPAHVPGAMHGYHGLTFGWLVGELIQRAGGESLANLIESEISRPLDLDGLFIGLPEHEWHRRARIVERKPGGQPVEAARRNANLVSRGLRFARIPVDLDRLEAALLPRGMNSIDWNSDEIAAACIPAANGMFTARSLAKLYAVLAAGGSLGGVELLSSETLERATEVQNRGLGCVVPFPMNWRLGFHRIPTVRARNPRAFGHFGFGGSGAWADPARDLSVAFTLNSGIGTPFGDTRIIRMGVAAVGAADRR